MSTIPKGQRADLMRARMEDKAVITSIGGLYMGSTVSATFGEKTRTTQQTNLTGRYATKMLAPAAGDADKGMPLTSQGIGHELAYVALTQASDAFADDSILPAKVKGNLVLTGSTLKKTLSIEQDGTDIVINFEEV